MADYRYYVPLMGSWGNRDPISELGFYLQRNARQVSQNELIYDPPTADIYNNPTSIVDLLIDGGKNSYEFNFNDSVADVDLIGLSPFCVCVQSNGDHAWIAVTDLANGVRHTYGRWYTGYPRNAPVQAKTSGVNIDVEIRYRWDVSRCVLLQNFTPTINAGYNLYDNNCTTYAASEWKRASGETLKKSGIFVSAPTFDYPTVLENSIRQKNNGVSSVGCSCNLRNGPHAW